MANTAANTANTDTRFVEMNYSVRSIAFGARKIDLLIGGKSNSGVCRDVPQPFARECHAHKQ
jgi:hypothetical protein